MWNGCEFCGTYICLGSCQHIKEYNMTEVIDLFDHKRRLEALKKEVTEIMQDTTNEDGKAPDSMMTAMHRKAVQEDQRKKDNESTMRRYRLKGDNK